MVGPAERLLGAAAYHDPTLRPLYKHDDVTVYQVVRPEAASSRP
jgi:hypothetical protein